MMSEILEREKRAKKSLDQGLKFYYKGDYGRARSSFEQSVRERETPEAYTYLANTYCLEGEVERAIELCIRAIELDADFGNPYNDIGVCYMKLGEYEKAKLWLEQAKKSTRYTSRQEPYVNLGRIYLTQGNFNLALKEFEVALEYTPTDMDLSHVVTRMRTYCK